MKGFYFLRQDVVKMKEPFIFLCSEISKENAYTLIKWLKDSNVRKYLSDTKNVAYDIEEVMNRVNLSVLTHLFNQNGRFYMVYDKKNTPVGFVRLIPRENECEIVVVIGDRKNWNKKLGTKTIHESMKIAFFEYRVQKVIAKIHRENHRSVKAFKNSGFKLHSTAKDLDIYTISMKDYLQWLNDISYREIFITDQDKSNIENVIRKVSRSDNPYAQVIDNLVNELDRATIVDSGIIEPDVITMNSRVLIQMDDEDALISLVYPQEEDRNSMNLSILSPIGTAIIGYKEGMTVEWEELTGYLKIHIKKIIYQPEAAGNAY